jgi:hypothetical protein
MHFDEVLRSWAAFFEAERIRYAVIGGLAIRAWGYARSTQDVDFVVDSAARDRVVAFAEDAGFETLHVSQGYSNHVRGNDRVDFMYVDAATAGQIFAGAQPRPVIEGVVLDVASPEHLAAMKAIAIKHNPRRAYRDINDVLFLLGLPGVDRAFIRDYFARKGMLDVFNDIEKHL